MKQKQPKTKPNSTENQLKPSAVWSQLSAQQQATLHQTLTRICQELAQQLAKTEGANERR